MNEQEFELSRMYRAGNTASFVFSCQKNAGKLTGPVPGCYIIDGS